MTTARRRVSAARRVRRPRRSRDWNPALAEGLRDPEFTREFLLAALDEGVSIQVALGKVVKAIGVDVPDAS